MLPGLQKTNKWKYKEQTEVEIALSQRIKAHPVPYSVRWLMQVTCEIHPEKIKTDNSKPACF